MKILIWDDLSEPPKNIEIQLILWKRIKSIHHPKAISMPEIVENNAINLRRRYLELIYEIGEKKVLNKRVIDHFEIHKGFSFWWMTLISEKCNWANSPQISDIIRIYALDDLMKKIPFQSIVLQSSDKNLVKCINEWCKVKKIKFSYRLGKSKGVPLQWKQYIYLSLPKSLQAILWIFKFIFEGWRLKGVGLQKWKRSKANITFVSYLFNLDPEAIKSGYFKCNYWTKLPDLLSKKKINTNWLHIYVKDPILKNSKEASLAIDSFNNEPYKFQTHTTLLSFLSLRVLMKTLIDWQKLKINCRQIEAEINCWKKTKILWPLLKTDWIDSIYGQPALSSILTLNLFNSALGQLSKQTKGIYLQENRVWEPAMINAWKKFGHDVLIGFPHTTVRFWDFSYFHDSRNYSLQKRLQIPLPDKIACNGKENLKAFKEGGYPEKKLTKVESLRFIYFSDHYKNKKLKKIHKSTNEGKRLLVVGDYVKKNTLKQLQILESAISLFDNKILITFKPHPACSLDVSQFPQIKMEIETRPLREIIYDFDIAYSSAITSAAVDAYCAGLPVISLFDGMDLNLSPLRGYDGVTFISSSEELADHVNKNYNIDKSVLRGKNYFYLDSDLSRWISILDLN